MVVLCIVASSGPIIWILDDFGTTVVQVVPLQNM